MPPPRAPGAGPLTLAGSPFSRSYGVNLPNSLTEAHSYASGAFSWPTGVGLRYGRRTPLARGFSGRQGRTGTRVVPKHALGRPLTLLSGVSPRTRYETAPAMSTGPAPLPGRVPPPLQTVARRCRTVDLLSIAYALRPRLRPD